LLKRTPLYNIHKNLGAKLAEFGGWEMPIEYSGIIEEHLNVRANAGLFDVSHMGEILVKGSNAMDFVQMLITNDISNSYINKITYSPICYQNGCVVDDLLVYHIAKDEFLLVVNASNTDKDFAWFNQNNSFGVKITNESSNYAQLALQGPNSKFILQELVDNQELDIKFFEFRTKVLLNKIEVLLSRSGYTGEDGFEIYTKSDNALLLWDTLMKAGHKYNLLPVGLGARDTLRFESALPLYGHETSNTITPLEASLDKYVKLYKSDFIGKAALISQKKNGIPRKLVGLEMIDRGIPRNDYKLYNGNKDDSIGYITSGSYSPSLKKNIGLALLKDKYSNPGTEVEVLIRNKYLKARVVDIPFYEKKYYKKISI